jgi:hypothetical protein
MLALPMLDVAVIPNSLRRCAKTPRASHRAAGHYHRRIANRGDDRRKTR